MVQAALLGCPFLFTLLGHVVGHVHTTTTSPTTPDTTACSTMESTTQELQPIFDDDQIQWVAINAMHGQELKSIKCFGVDTGYLFIWKDGTSKLQ
jgi:hypothetical protein